MSAPMYEKCDEIIEIIRNLFDAREDLFGEMKKVIYPEMFAAGLRVDKSAPQKCKATLKIEGVKGSKTILNDEKKWLISGYKDRWDSCDSVKKEAIVASILRRVDYPTIEEINELAKNGKDYEYGKLVKPDVNDLSSFIKAFGLDWESNPIIPSIVNDKTIKI